MTAHSANNTLFAHAGEAHAEAVSESNNLFDNLAHQPAWVALSISVVVLVCLFAILNLFKLKLPAKLLSLLSGVIALSVIFFSHNPIVATILLSTGFILSFALAFLLLAPAKK